MMLHMQCTWPYRRWALEALESSRLGGSWRPLEAPLMFAWRLRAPISGQILARFLSTSRFGSGLLEVSLDEPWHVAICPELLELIDMLVIPRLARLKVLSVQTSILSFARLLGSPSQSLAHLESLSLDLCGVIHVREVTEQFANADILRRATQLRVLEISPRVLVDARITNVVMSLPIPWHQLTSLVIGELLDHAAWDLHRVLRGSHSLKRLRAKLPSVLSVEKRPLAANYVHNLPNLQHVELEGASMLSPALLMSLLPWNQLTSLKLSRLKLLPWNSSNDFTKGTAGIYIVLRECLQIGELSIHTVHEPPPEVATTFMLPRLKDLTVIKQSVPFLDQLIAPALVSLKLMGQAKNAFPARKLCDLIKRSECALATFTSLGISHCESPPTILQFLALVPSLDALHCRNLVLDPRCIHSLTSGEVLPQLRFLSCRLQEASLLPFVDGLEARAKAHRAKGMNPVMLRAIGYIGREETFPSELMENIALRMEQIKVEYGPGLIRREGSREDEMNAPHVNIFYKLTVEMVIFPDVAASMKLAEAIESTPMMEEIIKDPALRRKIEFEAGTTNDDILSDRERMLAKVMLADMERELYSLDQEIDPSIAKQAEIASVISRLQIALAPHKRLPTEALVEIFIHTVDGQSTRFPPTSWRCPWLLRKVCSRWRAVALNEPCLWNMFKLDARKFGTIPIPKLISLAKDVLPPAGPLFLSLEEPLNETRSGFAMRTILDTLVIPRLARLKGLSIETTISSFSHLLNTPSPSLANLESLHLDLWGASHIPEVAGQFSKADILKSATNLRMLEIRPRLLLNSRITNFVTSLPIRWHQLTSLVIGEFLDQATWDLHRVLGECRSLKRLRAKLPSVLAVDKRLIAENYVHNLPDLQHVELAGATMLSPSLLMNLLPWNQLVSLKITRIILLPWDSSNDSKTMIAGVYDVLRECLQVEELSMHALHEPPPEVATTFVLPRLKDLTLIKQSIPLLDQLITPALLSLKLMGEAKNAFPAGMLCDMITRSECALATFTSFGISHCDRPPNLLRFLNLVSSLHTLRFPDVVLDPPCIRSLANGEILPRLRSISCGLQGTSVVAFVDGLETRTKERIAKGVRPLVRHAIGYIHLGDSIPWESMRNITRRMEQIKIECGPDFSVRIFHETGAEVAKTSWTYDM
ncbi:hypothetical protein FPV67DRAFT_1456639 [Lyophyllum atratum]|nr:hypothetical protein FPV67DRAFT_1456639 [Lyophyllum atratum]